MNRIPSLHISKDKLIELLRDYGMTNKKADELASHLIISGSKYSLTGRSLLVTNEKLQKKAEKLSSANLSDSVYMNQVIQAVRRANKHKGVKAIRPGTKDYTTLKDITANANEFLIDFDIPREEGYKAYIQIAMKMLNNFFLAKIPNLHEAICNTFEAERAILEDENKSVTQELYKLFQRKIVEQVGDSFDVTPEKYKFFVEAAALCVGIGMTASHFIESQFAGFEWRNGIPAPAQLIGEKAKARAIQWAYANKVKLKGKEKPKVNFSMIKKLGDDND